MGPTLALRAFLILVISLFSALLLLLVFHYHTTVWHTPSSEIITYYLLYFVPLNLACLWFFHVLFLGWMQLATTSFFTEFLVTGTTPAKLRQLKSASETFRRIFGGRKKFRESYSFFKKTLQKEHRYLSPFNFKKLLVSYATARNDVNPDSSVRLFSLYLRTYPQFFFRLKSLGTFVRGIFLSTILILTIFLMVENVPNILHLPHYRTLHMITGIILGYGLYEAGLSPWFSQLEVVKMLRFLQKRPLPAQAWGSPAGNAATSRTTHNEEAW